MLKDSMEDLQVQVADIKGSMDLSENKNFESKTRIESVNKRVLFLENPAPKLAQVEKVSLRPPWWRLGRSLFFLMKIHSLSLQVDALKTDQEKAME